MAATTAEERRVEELVLEVRRQELELVELELGKHHSERMKAMGAAPLPSIDGLDLPEAFLSVIPRS